MPTQAELVDRIIQTSGDLPRRAALHPPMLAPTMHVSQLAAMIDHTLLKPEAGEAQIHHLCAEAREHHFATVCVNPTWVELCRQALFQSDVKVCTVIGFPLGATLTVVKAYEAQQAIRAGAQEVDMVLNIGRLKGDQFLAVYTDIQAVVDVAHAQSALVKVILETALLTEDEIVAACVVAAQAGADFVKTSTGFSTSGASAGDVHMMRLVVGPDLGVKAAGGIRTAGDALALVAAGATRIGASAGVQILHELASGEVIATPASAPKEPY